MEWGSLYKTILQEKILHLYISCKKSNQIIQSFVQILRAIKAFHVKFHVLFLNEISLRK